MLSYTLIKVNSGKDFTASLSDYLPLLTDSLEPEKPEMLPEQKENLRAIAMERMAILKANKKR